MNNYVYIGKIVNTHGIKGELRILSDFDKKEIIFRHGFDLYIGPNYIKETIDTYRHHKEYDMVTFNNYSNINEVLQYKGLAVYIKRDDLNLKKDEYILDDLINLDIVDNEETLGKVVDYIINKNNTLLVIKGEKQFYIPLVDDYIIKVDLPNKKIITKNVKDLIL